MKTPTSLTTYSDLKAKDHNIQKNQANGENSKQKTSSVINKWPKKEAGRLVRK